MHGIDVLVQGVLAVGHVRAMGAFLLAGFKAADFLVGGVVARVGSDESAVRALVKLMSVVWGLVGFERGGIRRWPEK